MKTLWEKSPASDRPSANRERGASDREWFYRFTAEEDREWDRHLIACDILVNLAQAEMLHRTGVYETKGFQKVSEALREAWQAWTEGAFDLSPDDEDVHSAIENYLIRAAGQDGARIHTGRSRNDQVVADVRLYIREAVCEIMEEWILVAERLTELGRMYRGVFFAGHTHMQPAMPHSVDAWAAGYLDLITADMQALRQAFEQLDQSPLGSAAGYGVPHVSVDREFLSELLGFSRLQIPVASIQLSRGRYELQLVDALCYGALTFNRMASDIVWFKHPSWSLVELSEDQISGSSIMPQKQNPDAWELVRGMYHQLMSSRNLLAGIPANLTSGYHRDLQGVKKAVMTALQDALFLAGAVRKSLCGLEFNVQNAKKSLTPEIFATHWANKMVSQGVPFREAYKKVAQQVEEGLLLEASDEKDYLHTGGPGSLLPDELFHRLSESSEWLAGCRKNILKVRKRLLGKHVSDRPVILKKIS